MTQKTTMAQSVPDQRIATPPPTIPQNQPSCRANATRTIAALVSALGLLAMPEIALAESGSLPAIDVVQQAYLKASNTDAGDQFGYSVAIDGDRILVGAFAEDSRASGVNGDQADNHSFSSYGAAYLFERFGSTWFQTDYFKASNPGRQDGFGSSVAIDGSRIVVGAPGEGSAATGVNGDQTDNSLVAAGAAYVFAEQDGIWSQVAYLKASDTPAGRSFGSSVAISANTAIIGAPWNGNSTSPGSACVFEEAGGTWSPVTQLSPSGDPGTNFGVSVAVEGDRMLVGSDQDRRDSSGAIYLYRKSGAEWCFSEKLKASNPGDGDLFGYGAAISGDLIVGGARQESSSAAGVNADQDDNSAQSAGAGYILEIVPVFPEIEVTTGGASIASRAAEDFGTVVVDTTTVERDFLVENLGDAPLEGLGLQLMDNAGGAFVISQDLGASSLAPGGQLGFSIAMSPASDGQKSARLEISSNDADENPFVVMLTGLVQTPLEAATTAFEAADLSGDDALPGAIPFSDGVPNLLKYAFNMNLAGEDISPRQPGGDSGLPTLGLFTDGEGQTFCRLEFVRRVASGLIYTPRKSMTLVPGSFVPMTGSTTIEPIVGTTTFERVIVDEPCNPGGNGRFFCHVLVSIP